MKSSKKFLSVFLFSLIVFSLFISSVEVVSAVWYEDVFNFFGFGETSQQIFVSIFIFIIIAAATYDVLGLTAFSEPVVKILIGVGLAGIASITGAVRAIGGVAFSLAGGIATISIALIVILGFVAMFLIHVGVSKFAVLMLKAKGDVEAQKARSRAQAGAATIEGAREGITG